VVRPVFRVSEKVEEHVVRVVFDVEETFDGLIGRVVGSDYKGTGLLLGKALPLGIGDVYPPLCANPVGWPLGRMIRRSR
jgi:hypothetical protein